MSAAPSLAPSLRSRAVSWASSRSLATLATVLALVAGAALSGGCGLAAALAVDAISDAIDGDNDDGGDPTVLTVRNDGASLDAIVRIDVARADAASPPKSYTVSVSPGGQKKISNVFDAGVHWVRAVYTSGWRTRARAVTVIKDQNVSVTLLHGAPEVASLAGSWSGAVEAAGDLAVSYAFTLDGAGGASGRTVDGVADLATGVVTETSEGVYRVVWSDGEVAALVVDAARAHLGVVVDDGSAGALELGAGAPLPPAVDADAVGTWAGATVRLDADLLPVDLDAASATVSPMGNWQGSDGDGDRSFGATPLVVTSSALRRFAADAEDGAMTPLRVAFGLCADGVAAFVAVAPVSGATFPTTSTFHLLDKAP